MALRPPPGRRGSSRSTPRSGIEQAAGLHASQPASAPHRRLSAEGDLRPVTILFADVRGFTRLAERLPAEQLVAAINHCFDALGDVIVRYGGEIDKFIGDAIMARFGAPVAHGDDPRRAVLAALDMHVALRALNHALREQLGIELEMRVGVNTGTVLAGPIGSRNHREYTVMGDAVNVASRLEHSAPVGGVLIGESTSAHLGGEFRLRRRRAVRVRGREGPVTSFVVLGHAPRGRMSRGLTCLGRTAEIAEIQHALRPIQNGAQRIVRVEGRMGIGKTQVVEAVRRTPESRRYSWLGIACPPYGQDLPYATLAALLRGLIRHLEGADGETGLEALVARAEPSDGLDAGLIAAVVRDLLVTSEDGNVDLTHRLPAQYRKGILARATKILLRASSSRRPQAIVLDDVQWLDTASAAIIGEAMADLRETALGWILVNRPEWTPPIELPVNYSLTVPPLESNVCADLARTLLGGEATDESVSFVVERAEGNPLYLAELCSSAATTGALAPEQLGAARSGHDTPRYLTDHLRSLILARVDALEEPLRQVLHVAAVLGHGFPSALLRGVLESKSEQGRLRTLESRGFLVRQSLTRGDGAGTVWAWRFRHPLMQETIYASLLSSTRSVLHRKAGEALEALSDREVADRLVLLALHFGRSDDRDKAVHYLRGAGDRARALYLNREAVRYYDDALARLGMAGEDRQRRAAILGAKGAVLEVLAEDVAALDCLLLALQLEADAEKRADLWREAAEVYRRRGAYANALEGLTQAELSLESKPASLLHARICTARAMLDMDQRAYAGTLEWSRKALRILERLDAPRETAAAYRALGIAAAQEGDLRAARDALDRGLRAARLGEDALTSATIASNLANVVRFLGSTAEARALHGESLEFYERVGAKRGIAMACNNIADLAWQMGDWTTAEQNWRRAIALDEQIGDRRGMAVELSNLGSALVQRGDLREGRELLGRAQSIARELGDHETLASVREQLARLTVAPTTRPKRHAA